MKLVLRSSKAPKYIYLHGLDNLTGSSYFLTHSFAKCNQENLFCTFQRCSVEQTAIHKGLQWRGFETKSRLAAGIPHKCLLINKTIYLLVYCRAARLEFSTQDFTILAFLESFGIQQMNRQILIWHFLSVVS